MNKETLKELAKEHGTVLGSQILTLIGQALINFANQVANPKKTFKTDEAFLDDLLTRRDKPLSVISANFDTKSTDIQK